MGFKVIGLVACSKTKLSRPAPAGELYTGTLFKLSVRWLRPRVDGWAILSAKYGVVLPDQVIEPYEKTLIGASRAVISSWNERTNAALRRLFPEAQFLAICGKAYRGAMDGLEFDEPFAGLPIGKKLGALSAAVSQ